MTSGQGLFWPLPVKHAQWSDPPQMWLCPYPYTTRALPITIDILLKIYNHIDLSDVKHATIWSLFLFAFFLMARKSNLVPDSVHKFDSKKQLTREKIVLIY